MKTYKNIKIMKVTAYPLDKELNNLDRDFFISIGRGFKLPEIKEDYIVPNVRNAAKAIMMDNKRLSYSYKAGDVTCFQVKYKLDSKSGTKNLTFVTKKNEK